MYFLLFESFSDHILIIIVVFSITTETPLLIE